MKAATPYIVRPRMSHNNMIHIMPHIFAKVIYNLPVTIQQRHEAQLRISHHHYFQEET